jgi:hypothetical protein
MVVNIITDYLQKLPCELGQDLVMACKNHHDLSINWCMNRIRFRDNKNWQKLAEIFCIAKEVTNEIDSE